MAALSQQTLDDLKCSKCRNYLSFGPVAKSSGEGFLCGRCSGDLQDTAVAIYEAVARNCLFPCRYEEAGCQEKQPFGEQMKEHEASCRSKPYLCPNLPVENCEWSGPLQAIQEHYKERHPDLILQNPSLEVDLQETKQSRYLYPTSFGLYAIDVIHFDEKGLSVEVSSFTSSIDNYDLTLRSAFQPGVMTFPKTVGAYDANSNFLKVSGNLIDPNVLKYFGNERIALEIGLKGVLNSCDICKGPVCRCSVESVPYGKLTASKYIFQACKHRPFGCSYMNYLPDVIAHEETCLLHECPLKSENCEWKGKMEEIPGHCIKNHQVNENLVNLDLPELLTNTEKPKFYVLKSAYGFFRVCLNFEDDGKLMYCTVQYLGTDESAGRYVFDVKFYTSGTTNTKSFICAPLTSDEDTFDYCAHFSYDRLRDSKVTFTVRKKTLKQ